MRHNLRKISRWLTWVCIGILTALSWLPADTMIRTAAPGQLEHFVAYLGMGSVAAFGYGRRVSYIQIVLLLAVYAGVLEIGQLLVPGRHSRLIDFLAGSAGAIAGTFAIYLCDRSRSSWCAR